MSKSAKNTAPREQGAENVRSEIFENRATYLEWKKDMARCGKTPEAVVAYYREKGLTEYADCLEKAILQMEGSL